MISVLVRRIMEECGLKQQELADVLGVPLARVKRLSGGTVQKWSAEEQIALTQKLGISPNWLITGQGEMFEDGDDESDEEFENRIFRINHMREVVAKLPLDEFSRARLAAVMTGMPETDAAHIAAALTSGHGRPVMLTAAEHASLNSLREGELLKHFRACPEVGREAIEGTARALASLARAKDPAE